MDSNTDASGIDRLGSMRTTKPAPVASTSPHMKGFGRLTAEPLPTAADIAQFNAEYKLRLEASKNADAARNAAQAKVDNLKATVDGLKGNDAETKEKKSLAQKDLENASKELETTTGVATTAHAALVTACEARDMANSGKMPPKAVPGADGASTGQETGDKNPDGTLKNAPPK